MNVVRSSGSNGCLTCVRIYVSGYDDYAFSGVNGSLNV